MPEQDLPLWRRVLMGLLGIQRPPQNPQYKAFDCGLDCHPDRYVVFTTRTWWGRKRWGIHDKHMGINLSRLRTNSEAAERWRISLATMELRERQRTEATEQ